MPKQDTRFSHSIARRNQLLTGYNSANLTNANHGFAAFVRKGSAFPTTGPAEDYRFQASGVHATKENEPLLTLTKSTGQRGIAYHE